MPGYTVVKVKATKLLRQQIDLKQAIQQSRNLANWAFGINHDGLCDAATCQGSA